MRAMRVKSVAGQERRQARRARQAGGRTVGQTALQRTADEDSGTGNDVDGAEAEDT